MPDGKQVVRREIVRESLGRVRAVRTGPGVIQYQDPDLRYRDVYEDGSVSSIRHDVFIGHEKGIARLSFNLEERRLVDSFGRRVGIANLKIPGRGLSFKQYTRAVNVRRIAGDPRYFVPKANQDVVEKVVFINRDGTLRIESTSYGLGKKYDKTRRSGWWKVYATDAAGIDWVPGKIPKENYEKMKATVLSREVLVRTWR